MNKPLVSIIINCFNGQKFLKEALQSVLDQTYKNWELIFWDNQSIDRSAEIFKSYKDDRFKYFFSSKHTLLYEARNSAILHCRGDFIAFLDVDDYWDYSKLEKQIPLFKDQNVGLVYGNFWQIKLINNKYKSRLPFPNYLPKGKITNHLLKEYVIGLLTIVIRRKAIENINKPFNPKYHVIGDYDLSLRISTKWDIDRIEQPIAFYRIHENNESIKHKDRQYTETDNWYNEMKNNQLISNQSNFSQVKQNVIIMKIIRGIKDGNRTEAFKDILNLPLNYKRILFTLCLFLPKYILIKYLNFYEYKKFFFAKSLKSVFNKKIGNNKILHIITGLSLGGTELNLYRIIKHDKNNFHIIISMMDKGEYGQKIIDAGFDLYTLGMSKTDSKGTRGSINIRKVFLLYSLIKVINPDIVQTWLYHADFVGGILARIAGVKNIFWNIRSTHYYTREITVKTKIIIRLCSVLSFIIPKKIICNSKKSLKLHKKLRFQTKKLSLINNGYNLSKFRPDINLRKKYRNILKFDSSETILGMVARWDPLKDHENLLKSLKIVKENCKFNWKMILIGSNIIPENTKLSDSIRLFNLEKNILLLGPKKDLIPFYNLMDIHVLSSSAESFPNVVAESMACGTPCVVTDVGDSSFIIGRTGWIVPTKNSVELSNAILSAIELYNNESIEWEKNKKLCILRISDKFNINDMILNYNNVWSDISRFNKKI